MWENVGERWNGAVAASVYKGPMLKALRRTWGARSQYTIIEDGDRKGNQSNKGKAAKQYANIKAQVLPPRTPCWMPLDYAIWHAVMERVLNGAPEGTETKAAFEKRLKQCAKSLPRSFVAAQIARMKKNIQGVIAAKGYNPKWD